MLARINWERISTWHFNVLYRKDMAELWLQSELRCAMSRDIYNRRDLESGAFASARQLWMFHRIIPISISFFFPLIIPS